MLERVHQEPLEYTTNILKEGFHAESLSEFSVGNVEKVLQFQITNRRYARTPLVRLTNLAAHLGVEDIYIKDEAQRFGLNAFKVLGGVYAIARYLAEKLNRDIETLSFAELRSAESKKITGEITFVAATDGNHGRGVAWAAHELGHNAIIYMPKGSSQTRLQAIRDEGAAAEITQYNYDESVRLVAVQAEENGWVMIQDTSWSGYEKIPLWIMQGYAVLAKEAIEQMHEQRPSHLLLQAGVGSFAGAIAGYFVEYYREHRPKIIIVEPHSANCFYRSFAAADHTVKTVDGEMNTIMAGLACGEPNPKAWSILKRCTDAAISVDDRIAALGMRILGNPLRGDERLISGESGAVTTGVLYYLMKEHSLQNVRDQLGLGFESRIMLISTEGDTDQEHYREIVWEGALSLG